MTVLFACFHGRSNLFNPVENPEESDNEAENEVKKENND